MPSTSIELSIEQLSVSPLSKVARSLDVGNVVSFDPPDDVDQLALSSKDPPDEPIQYLVAACACVAQQSIKTMQDNVLPIRRWLIFIRDWVSLDGGEIFVYVVFVS